jgi:drug/metabolite transporter (DMT)-like permease
MLHVHIAMSAVSDASQQPSTLPPSAILLLAGLTLGWGFNWTVIKVVLEDMAPLSFRLWCVLGGAAGLFALARLNGLSWRVPAGQWRRLTLIALFNVLLWNVFVVHGVALMDSGRAAILTFTLPVWSTLGGVWLLGERMDARKWLGLAFGVAGILLLIGGDLHKMGQAPLGTLLMLGASISWALGTICTKRWPVDLPASSFTAWQLLLAAPPLALGSLVLEPGGMSLAAVSGVSVSGVLYNVFVSSMFCMWAWTRIVVIVPATVSSISPLLIPVVGVFSGMFVLGERPQWSDFAALVLISGALATVVVPGRRAA